MRDRDLELDAGQLIWASFEGTVAPADLLDRIGEGLLGGVVLFARNIAQASELGADVPAVFALVEQLHRAATRDPLLVCIDQEGGLVQRIREPASVWPPMLSIDDEGLDPLDIGRTIGAELDALGIDVNFAPVLDVCTNESGAIGRRAFSREPKRAAELALLFARGLAEAGVLSCGKHFPGHGDTDTDAHSDTPRLAHDLERLRSVELVPFRAAVGAGVPMIMMSHIVVEALGDDLPASMSPAAIRILREELGFEGAIVADDVSMHGICARYDSHRAAVQAIAAGCDAILLCRNRFATGQLEIHRLLVEYGSSGLAARERVAEAAASVRALKARRALTIRRAL